MSDTSDYLNRTPRERIEAELDIALAALNTIARSSRDDAARQVADSALAKIAVLRGNQ